MEFLNTLINWLAGSGLSNVLATATSVVGAFALLASVTPTKSDDAIVAVLQKVIHFLGANFGQAKNKF